MADRLTLICMIEFLTAHGKIDLNVAIKVNKLSNLRAMVATGLGPGPACQNATRLCSWRSHILTLPGLALPDQALNSPRSRILQ